LGLTLIQFGLVVGLLPRKAFLGSCFYCGFSGGNRLEAVCTAGDLCRQVDAFRYLLVIRRLG
jgi:hypothetical protein